MKHNYKLIHTLKSFGRLKDENIDVIKTALILGALDQPSIDLNPYYSHVSNLSKAASKGKGIDELYSQIDFINQLMFKENGYKGDTEDYENPENANLINVINKRSGLPITIGILYIYAARAAGYDIRGLAFPGHFLVRLSYENERAIIDPFNLGMPLKPEQLRDMLKQFVGVEAKLVPKYYAAVSNRDMLLRLQNNIKGRALRQNNAARAIEILERIILFAPNVATVWKELGMISIHSGNLNRAINSLEKFRDLALSKEEVAEANLLINKIRMSLN